MLTSLEPVAKTHLSLAIDILIGNARISFLHNIQDSEADAQILPVKPLLGHGNQSVVESNDLEANTLRESTGSVSGQCQSQQQAASMSTHLPLHIPSKTETILDFEILDK